MRKLVLVAVAATATLAVATTAIADPNDDQASLTVKASPTNAGTKNKPTNVKLGFNTKVDLPGTTVGTIDVLLPNGLKFADQGLQEVQRRRSGRRGRRRLPVRLEGRSEGHRQRARRSC